MGFGSVARAGARRLWISPLVSQDLTARTRRLSSSPMGGWRRVKMAARGLHGSLPYDELAGDGSVGASFGHHDSTSPGAEDVYPIEFVRCIVAA